MCGISGIISLENGSKVDTVLLARMTLAVSHRGPDDEGYFLWNSKTWTGLQFSGKASSEAVRRLHPQLDPGLKTNLGLGFRRLAILDTSEGGHQPMYDPELGLAIVFNGEIYNYLELRDELTLAGYAFTTGSDTEVILKAYHAWGEGCLERFNGIWALAIWDGRKLFCSRDRFGVKPFYYCVHDRVLYFGSEIKQLLLTGVDKSLNEPMLWRSMKINSLQVYGEETFWRNINALPAGHNLIIQDGSIIRSCYHRLDPDTFGSSGLTITDAVERYRDLFERAVKLQLRSDVEVGACLSGGLDSSAIVCAASKLAAKPLQTFSSFFAEVPALDERRWIAAVASQCGCASHLTSPGVEDALAWFEDATWYNDLPVGAGFAAQYGVMKLAQQKGIKVLLDGQGSDELTAGYKHAQYRYLAELLRKGELKNLGAEIGAFLKTQGAGKGLSGLTKSLLATLLPESRLYDLEFKYLRFEPFNRDFTQRCRTSLSEAILAGVADTKGGKLSNFLYNAVYSTSLPTLLHWEDRMSMAASIESRVPFLDHELAELAFSLPSHYKISHATGKHVHRQAMRDIVPAEVFARQGKSVFGSPFHALWLRGGMQKEVEAMFASAEFRRRGIWDLPRIGANWQKYLRGDDSQAEMIFNVFALETWFRVWG
ncbi:MAG: asparagine synthase (glutamine-hydrolyzing) [Candidatus Syntrophosphaera sp.]|nr:asparagine synthase (glutamine-hydrolyzing) [Candidatus Syntrophosphaera sp.]